VTKTGERIPHSPTDGSLVDFDRPVAGEEWHDEHGDDTRCRFLGLGWTGAHQRWRATAALVDRKGKPETVWMGGHRSNSSRQRGSTEVREAREGAGLASGRQEMAGDGGARGRRRRRRELGCSALVASASS
jgi:hypothetical protein